MLSHSPRPTRFLLPVALLSHPFPPSCPVSCSGHLVHPQPIYCSFLGNRDRAVFMGGKGSHCCSSSKSNTSTEERGSSSADHEDAVLHKNHRVCPHNKDGFVLVCSSSCPSCRETTSQHLRRTCLSCCNHRQQ